MRRSLLTALAIPLLSLAVSLPAPLQAQVGVKLTGVSNATVVNGVYVGPYTLAMPGAPSLDVYCVDFLNEVNINDMWSAFATPLATPLTDTRLGEAARNLYVKAAWLTGQFATSAKSEWGAIHAAIWYTMTPGASPDLTPANFYKWQTGTTTVQQWLNLANANWGSVDISQFAIITDVNAVGQTPTGGKQEYLARNVPPQDLTVTPEPATMLLLGSGLAGTFAARKKRRKVALEIESGEAA